MFEFLKRNESKKTEYRELINTIVTTYSNYLETLSGGGAIIFTDAYFDNISTVNICVKTLADRLATLPLNVYSISDGSKKVDKTDYRYKILHNTPNNYLSSFSFWHFLESQRGYRGNAFALINRVNGNVVSLTPIYTSQVSGYNKINGELYYTININNNEEKINASNILHFRGETRNILQKNTNDVPAVWGKTPIEALRLNLSLSYKAIKTVDSIYENETKTTKALKTQNLLDGLNSKAFKEAVEKLKIDSKGFDKAGEYLILPNNTEIQELSMPVNDALFLNTVKFNATQIASWYGVPLHKVGIFEAQKFNNVETMSLEFKTETIDTICRMYRQELEFKLLTDEEIETGMSIEFNTNAMLELDNATRMKQYESLQKTAGMTFNEVRILENMPLVEGGDESYIFNQMVPLTNLTNEASSDDASTNMNI